MCTATDMALAAGICKGNGTKKLKYFYALLAKLCAQNITMFSTFTKFTAHKNFPAMLGIHVHVVLLLLTCKIFANCSFFMCSF